VWSFAALGRLVLSLVTVLCLYRAAVAATPHDKGWGGAGNSGLHKFRGGGIFDAWFAALGLALRRLSLFISIQPESVATALESSNPS